MGKRLDDVPFGGSFVIKARVLPSNGGASYTVPLKISYKVVKVIYNNPATIVIWDDGTKTISKCSAEDTYNPTTGLTVAVLKKLVGGESLRRLYDDWLPEDSQTVICMKDVRYKHKLKNRLSDASAETHEVLEDITKTVQKKKR